MAKRQSKVKKYLNMSSKQISKMSDKELRQAVTILNSAANKRIKRVYQAGLSSGKIDKQLENGKFSVAGVEGRAALENALIDVSGFMKSKTTTVKGIKSAQQKTFKNLAKVVNKELPEDERIQTGKLANATDQELKELTGLIWSQVDKLSEDKTLGITKKERYTLAAHAYNVATRRSRPVKTKQGLIRNLRKFYESQYQKSIADTNIENLTQEEQDVAALYSNFT